jgi:hypothetical protein
LKRIEFEMSTRLFLASTTSFLSAALICAAPATAQCAAVDAFEPNDDCTSASVIAPGYLASLTAQGPALPSGANLDFFRVSLPPGEALEVTAFFESHDTGDLDLYLYDALSATCGDRGTALESSTSQSDGERVHYINSTTTMQDLIIEVGPKTGADVICQTYDLDVQIGLDRCVSGAATYLAFEDNDDCANSATLAGSGAWLDLFVSDADPDYYQVTLQPGEQINATIEYDAFDGELSLKLYDDALCANTVRSSSSGGRNDVSWENTSAVAVDLTLHVSTQSGARCNVYALNLSVGLDPCIATVNDSFGNIETCATAATVTPGTYSDLFVGGPERDCFRIVVPADEVLFVDVHSPRFVNGDLGMGLYTDQDCNSAIDYDYYGGTISVSSRSSSPVDTEYWVKVFTMSPSECNTYELNVTTAPDPCVTAVDDVFEPNDDCSSPSLIAPGVYADLLCRADSPDYYEVVLQPSEQLEVTMSYARGGGQDVKMLLQDVGCTTTIDYGGSSDGANALWSNAGSSPVSVIVSIELQGLSATSCVSYDLILDVGLDPCLTTPDDAFSGNDDCANAALINIGLHEDLFVKKSSPDYYELNVDLGDTLTVSMDYDTTNTDVRLRLYEAIPMNGGTCDDGSSYLTAGSGSNGTKALSWQNTLASGDYVIEVEVGQWSSSDCTMYALTIDGAGAPLATPLCFGDGTADAGQGPTGCPCANLSAVGAGEGCVNSTGHGAVLNAAGSNSFAADNLRLRIEDGVPWQPSLVLQGGSVIAYPFKDGILCMGHPTERLEVVMLDANGSGTTFGSIVTEGNITGPGTTTFYQAWYRDPVISACGTGSNFTQALRVDWN